MIIKLKQITACLFFFDGPCCWVSKQHRIHCTAS